MNLRYKLNQFMYGRYITYGMDLLTKALLVICIALSVVNLFLGSYIIQFAETLLFIYMFYRLFSKNISKRTAENGKMINLLGKIKGFFKLRKRMHSERQTHIYKKCPHCSVTLRLPRRAGEHNVNCPRCKNDFKVKVR